MSEAIIVAIITGLGALAGNVAVIVGSTKNTSKTIQANHNATLTEIKSSNKLMEQKLDSTREDLAALSKKVEAHNNYDRRIVAMETKGDMMERMLEKLTDDGK